MTPIAIALGSNVGDREAHLNDAVASLAAFVSNIRLSRFFETEPVETAGQQRNAMGRRRNRRATLRARDLLQLMLDVEDLPGLYVAPSRRRPHGRY